MVKDGTQQLLPKLLFLTTTIIGFILGLRVANYRQRKRQSYEKSRYFLKIDSEANEQENEIWMEQLIRNRQFFGDNGQNQIENSYVIIVGVGGVGMYGTTQAFVEARSHCAISLTRSGIGRLRLIDFDQVSVSSLNRHASATRQDVGISKVEALKNTIHQISTRTKVETCSTLFKASDAENLICGGFNGKMPDYVIDCIDNVPTKVDLIKFCHLNEICCISSGGAGGKSDPTKIRIDDISDTIEDDLCRVIRQRLRKEGIHNGPKFCYSTERDSRDLLPLHDFQKASVEEYRPFEQFRVRVIPVIGPIPAIFGQAIASHVLCELGGQPISGLQTASKEAAAVDRVTKKNFRQFFGTIKQHVNQNGKIRAATKHLELDYGTTRHIYLTIFHGCSIISNRQSGSRALQIVPWKLYNNSLDESFSNLQNLVCMTQQEATEHILTFPNGLNAPISISDTWDPTTIERVDNFLKHAPPIRRQISHETQSS